MEASATPRPAHSPRERRSSELRRRKGGHWQPNYTVYLEGRPETEERLRAYSGLFLVWGSEIGKARRYP